jgi:hypothetical protein
LLQENLGKNRLLLRERIWSREHNRRGVGFDSICLCSKGENSMSPSFLSSPLRTPGWLLFCISPGPFHGKPRPLYLGLSFHCTLQVTHLRESSQVSQRITYFFLWASRANCLYFEGLYSLLIIASCLPLPPAHGCNVPKAREYDFLFIFLTPLSCLFSQHIAE